MVVSECPITAQLSPGIRIRHEIMEVAEINLLGGNSVSVALSGLSQKELLYLTEAVSCTVRL